MKKRTPSTASSHRSSSIHKPKILAPRASLNLKINAVDNDGKL